jgi:hypothetical protein
MAMGVNIAARIEALADAGGVLVSNTVHDHVRDRLPFLFEDLGEQQVKNIARLLGLSGSRRRRGDRPVPCPEGRPLGDDRVDPVEDQRPRRDPAPPRRAASRPSAASRTRMRST